MPVENAEFISQLEPNRPQGGESISEGDDHLRAIKTAVKGSFPKIDSVVNSTPAELNAVGKTASDVEELKQILGGLDGDAHGNVASCYYDVAFLDAGLPNKGLVYQYNVARVIQDPDNASYTRVVFLQALDNYPNSSSAHYAFNITPITPSGLPHVVSVIAPTKDYFSFVAHEWDGSNFQIVPGGRQSFSLTVIDMDKGQ